MLIETFIVGILSTNCYVVSSQKTKDAIIIDPGLDSDSEARQISDYIARGVFRVRSIVNTHGHSDHINGDFIFQKEYNIPICIHRFDMLNIKGMRKTGFPAPLMLEDDSLIEFGDESLKVMHTPGHTPGSICLLGEGLVFTGDTLFAEGIGRTDFPESSDSDMKLSLQKLMHLPDYFLIYPGHGPTSVIGYEKRVNPFLGNRESF
jgi:hydroxyacylglutathione hydrolase